MINLLYCFDRNYNVQALVSIMSFIEKNHRDINLFIIHKEPETFEKYAKKITNFKNVDLTIKKFEKKRIIPFDVGNAHFSEATYYRLFMNEYIEKNIKHILYIDPDILCLKNVEKEYLDIIDQLKKSNNIVAAKTDAKFNDEPELFKRLNMKKSYFNAGILFVDLEKWRDLNIQNKLISKINELGQKITLADQDAMNSYFDGEYVEIDKTFNFWANHDDNNKMMKYMDNNVFFLHFSGSTKPWTPYGGIDKISNYYHEQHFKIFHKYHIVFNNKKNDFYILVKKIITFKILQLDKPFLYVFDFLKIFLKSDNNKID